MELNDTVKMMKSDDYKERFRAEALQLVLRIQGLQNMLNKYKDGTLNFEPKCSFEILNSQLFFMRRYLGILEDRARIEGIDLRF